MFRQLNKIKNKNVWHGLVHLTKEGVVCASDVCLFDGETSVGAVSEAEGMIFVVFYVLLPLYITN